MATHSQYSCLENTLDRGAWWASVHGVMKSRTQLSTHAFFLDHYSYNTSIMTSSYKTLVKQKIFSAYKIIIQLLSFSIHSTTVPLGPQRLPFLINSSAGSIGLVLKVHFCFTYFSLSSLPPSVIRHPSFISCNNSLSGFTVLTPEFFSSISTQ